MTFLSFFFLLHWLDSSVDFYVHEGQTFFFFSPMLGKKKVVNLFTNENHANK